MDYQETVTYLKSFINYEKSSFYSYPRVLRLNRVKALVDFLEIPYNDLNYIHIAGSKGKGSICSMVTSILVEAGYKVGLFTSPHFETVRERIRVFDSDDIGKNIPDMQGLISKDELIKLVEKIKPGIEGFQKQSKYGKVTFFEVYTILAISYFISQKIDFAVLEVGLGGKLDATNIVHPLVSGISSLSMDHMDKLGDTLESIAEQKAGIIKKNSVVVSSPQKKEALKVLKKVSKEKKSVFYQVNKDILYEHVGITEGKEVFNLKFLYNEYYHLEVPLLGEHQVVNAATAIGIIEALSKYQVYIDSSIVKRGLKRVNWPGRFDIVHKNPTVLLDGAQNRASAEVLKNSVLSRLNYDKLYLILGICRDKDIAGVCDTLFPLAKEVFLTKVKNPRSALPEDINKKIREQLVKTSFIENPENAAKEVLSKAGNNDLILITGSLFLVGQLRPKFTQNIKTPVSTI